MNTKDASPAEIVIMENMVVLLHLLQRILEAQEPIILKIDKMRVESQDAAICKELLLTIDG